MINDFISLLLSALIQDDNVDQINLQYRQNGSIYSSSYYYPLSTTQPQPAFRVPDNYDDFIIKIFLRDGKIWNHNIAKDISNFIYVQYPIYIDFDMHLNGLVKGDLILSFKPRKSSRK